MTRSLRIAHLTPTYFSDDSAVGGGERYVHNVCRATQTAAAARGMGVESRIVAIGPTRQHRADDGIDICVLPSTSPYSSAMAGFSDELWDELNGTDVVHIHQSLTVFGAFASAVAASLRIPSVLTDHGGGHLPLMTVGRGLELASAVVSVSEYASNLLSGSYSGRQEVIIGPVDTSFFHPQGGSGNANRYITSLGRILPHKGFDRIIRSLPEGLSLKIVGRLYDQAYFDHLQLLSQGRQVEFVVDATDAEVRMLLANACAYVHASTSRDYLGRSISKAELMGLAPLEALACGAPIIVSETASLPELAPDSPYVRTFRSDGELADLLVDLAEHGWPIPVDRNEAWKYVHHRYGADTVGSRLLDVYLSVTQGSSP